MSNMLTLTIDRKPLRQGTVLVVLLGLIMTAAGYGDGGRRGSVAGVVRDRYTGRPLVGTVVEIQGTDLTTVTDPKGTFTLESVPVGTYALRFTYPGTQPQVKTDIVVKSDRTAAVDVSIELIAVVEETVEVTASYFNHDLKEAESVVGFNNEEIRRAAGAGGDVNRIIAGLPSIAQVSDQANNLVVRGGSTHENLYLVDNIPIPNINHFPFQGTAGGAISLINVDFIRDVEFYSGGFSTIFGNRLSSVMNLSLREGSRERLNGQLSVDFSGAGAVAEGPLPGKRGSWMISARRSYLDLLTDIMDAGAAVQYSDIFWKTVYGVTGRSKLTFLGVLGFDRSKVTREDAVELGESFFGDSENREYTVGLNWFWVWSDSGYSDTSLSMSSTRYDYDFMNTARNEPYLYNRSSEVGWHFRNVNYLNLSHYHQLKIGVEAEYLASRYRYRAEAYLNPLNQWIPSVSRDIDIGSGGAAAFIDYEMRPFSRMNLNLGLRADYFSYPDTVEISPRASLAFKISDRSSISVNAGIYRQTLPLLLLYGNDNNRYLKSPRAVQYSLGFRHLLEESVQLSLEAYCKEYRNFPIDPQRASLCLLDDIFGFSLFGDTALADAGRARSYGIEFILQKKLKEKFYGMISGSWFRTRYRDLQGVWRNRLYDNRYVFAVQGGFKPDNRWEFSVRWLIAGGRPYTPFDIDASQAVNSGIYDDTLINALRLPAYHSLNLRLDRRFYFSGSNLTAYLSVWNAYNHDNVAGYYWNEVENRPDFSYQFSLLPVIGLEFEF